MRLFLLNFLALLIAVSSVHFEFKSEISFKEGVEDALAAENIINQSPLRTPSNKNSHDHEALQLNHFDTANITSWIISTSVNFSYYLPIYSLIRAKEFFLLI